MKKRKGRGWWDNAKRHSMAAMKGSKKGKSKRSLSALANKIGGFKLNKKTSSRFSSLIKSGHAKKSKQYGERSTKIRITTKGFNALRGWGR